MNLNRKDIKLSSNTLRSLLIAIALIWIGIISQTSCVSIRTPDGGEDQKEPAQLTEDSRPFNGAAGFKGKKLVLVFDKPIKAEDLEKELIIMPSLKDYTDPKAAKKKLFSYRVSGKKLIIRMKVKLKEDTIYTFNFRNGIRNLNEDVISRDLSLTFSTGDKISTLSMGGIVIDIMTGQPVSNMIVAIYDSNKGNNIFRGPPDNFVKTNADGSFRFKFMNPGSYRVYASDKINYEYEEKKELGIKRSGFKLETYPVYDKSIKAPIIIPTTDSQLDVFMLKNATPTDSYFDIEFNNDLKDYSLIPTSRLKNFKSNPIIYSSLVEEEEIRADNTKPDMSSEKQKQGEKEEEVEPIIRTNKIRIYNRFNDSDSGQDHFLLSEDRPIPILVMAKDKSNQEIMEEVKISFADDSTDIQHPLMLKSHPVSGGFVKNKDAISLIANKPIVEAKSDMISLLTDTKYTYQFRTDDLEFNKDHTELKLKFNLVPEKMVKEKFELIIPKGAVRFVEDDELDSRKLQFKIKNTQNTGSVIGQIEKYIPGFIVDLIDEDGKVVDTKINESFFMFDYVLPGTYTLRVVTMQTPEGPWSPGDIRKEILPDPVIFYPKIIVVKKGSNITLEKFI